MARRYDGIAAEYTAKMIPGAKLSVYQGVGHSPFFEATRSSTPNLPPSCAAPKKGIKFAFSFLELAPPPQSSTLAGGDYFDSTFSCVHLHGVIVSSG